MSLDRLEIINRIRREYDAGDYGLGWRLLAGPAQTLCSARIAFLGLNPGGSSENTGHGEYSVENGSAYVVESWAGHRPGESPLQRQVRALFSNLSVDPVQVLAGNLIPFRSPSIKELPNKNRALAFGKDLWHDILDAARPELVIAMSDDATRAVASILGAEAARRIPLGWGTVTGVRSDYPGGTLVGLPHLSRFRIFGRDKSIAGINELFRGLSGDH